MADENVDGNPPEYLEGYEPVAGGRLFGKSVSGPVGGQPEGSEGVARATGRATRPVDAGATAVDPIEITAKRGRGRPRKDATSAGRSETAGTETGPRRLSEKAVKPEKPREPVKAEIPTTLVEQVAQGIFGLHQMGAAALAMPEMKLSEPEAQAIATSALNVAAWYSPIKAGASKWADWLALGGTLALVYGPRLSHYRARKLAQNARPVAATEG